MPWSAPYDWNDGEYPGATLFNASIRDNQGALKTPASASYAADEGTDYTLTPGAAWAAIDAVNMKFTLATAGGDVFAGFHGTFASASLTPILCLDIAVDDVLIGGDNGIIDKGLTTNMSSLSFIRLIPGLAAGEHTFELQWQTFGNVILYAGAGTANRDLHPQFWVREMS